MLGWLFYENYFDEYLKWLWNRFLEDFRDAQAPHVALGGTFFPIRSAFRLDDCLLLTTFDDLSIKSS